MTEPNEDAWVRSSFCESSVLIGYHPNQPESNIFICRESAPREEAIRFTRHDFRNLLQQVKQGGASGFTGEICIEPVENGLFALFHRNEPGKAIRFLQVELAKFYHGVRQGEFDDI